MRSAGRALQASRRDVAVRLQRAARRHAQRVLVARCTPASVIGGEAAALLGMRSGCCCVVFGRLPVAGRVKTRLAAGVGAAAAADFYAACLAHSLREAARAAASMQDARCALHYADAGDGPAVQRWLAQRDLHAVRVHAQLQSPDLGSRLQAAFEHALGAPGVGRAIVVASDVPDVTAGVLQQALEALRDHDVVLGHACDGGFWLIGLAAPHAAVFHAGIPWSTPGVLAATLAAARAAGLRVAPAETLPTLADIDTADDLRAWAAQGPGPTPHALRAPALAALRDAAA